MTMLNFGSKVNQVLLLVTTFALFCSCNPKKQDHSESTNWDNEAEYSHESGHDWGHAQILIAHQSSIGWELHKKYAYSAYFHTSYLTNDPEDLIMYEDTYRIGCVDSGRIRSPQYYLEALSFDKIHNKKFYLKIELEVTPGASELFLRGHGPYVLSVSSCIIPKSRDCKECNFNFENGEYAGVQNLNSCGSETRFYNTSY